MTSSKEVVEIAIKRQLRAMGAAEYILSVGVQDKMINSHVDTAGVMKRVDWLRASNVQGKNVYIKPAAYNTDLVLVDDVEYESIERMIADGLRPAVAVETSPDNFQAWIRVGSPLEPEMRRAVAGVIAREYGGDFGAVSKSQPGRLAGFTNRKDKYMNTRTGAYPWVTLLHWSGFEIEPGVRDDLLASAAAEVDLGDKEDTPASAIITQAVFEQGPPTAAQIKRPARVAYAGAMTYVINAARRQGQEIDLHVCDWRVCRELVKKGYSPAEIADAALYESPDLLARHRGAQAVEYVRRTVSKSFSMFGNPFKSPGPLPAQVVATAPDSESKRDPRQE